MTFISFLTNIAASSPGNKAAGMGSGENFSGQEKEGFLDKLFVAIEKQTITGQQIDGDSSKLRKDGSDGDIDLTNILEILQPESKKINSSDSVSNEEGVLPALLTELLANSPLPESTDVLNADESLSITSTTSTEQPQEEGSVTTQDMVDVFKSLFQAAGRYSQDTLQRSNEVPSILEAATSHNDLTASELDMEITDYSEEEKTAALSNQAELEADNGDLPEDSVSVIELSTEANSNDVVWRTIANLFNAAGDSYEKKIDETSTESSSSFHDSSLTDVKTKLTDLFDVAKDESDWEHFSLGHKETVNVVGQNKPTEYSQVVEKNRTVTDNLVSAATGDTVDSKYILEDILNDVKLKQNVTLKHTDASLGVQDSSDDFPQVVGEKRVITVTSNELGVNNNPNQFMTSAANTGVVAESLSTPPGGSTRPNYMPLDVKTQEDGTVLDNDILYTQPFTNEKEVEIPGDLYETLYIKGEYIPDQKADLEKAVNWNSTEVLSDVSEPKRVDSGLSQLKFTRNEAPDQISGNENEEVLSFAWKARNKEEPAGKISHPRSSSVEIVSEDSGVNLSPEPSSVSSFATFSNSEDEPGSLNRELQNLHAEKRQMHENSQDLNKSSMHKVPGNDNSLNSFNVSTSNEKVKSVHGTRAAETPVDPVKVAGQLHQGIRDAIRMHRSSAVLHLNPPELGSVKIRLSVYGGHEVKAVFVTDNPETRHVIHSGMDTLRVQLADSGYTLGNASVDVGQHEAFAGQQGEQGFNRFTGRQFADDNEMDVIPVENVDKGTELKSGVHMVM